MFHFLVRNSQLTEFNILSFIICETYAIGR